VNRKRVLVDTGPLVALLRKSDSYHGRCVSEFAKLPEGLPTSWPVITEAVYLLRNEPRGVRTLLELLTARVLIPIELGDEFAPWATLFFTRYADREPQLADASLVFLAEREGIDTVLTLDRRDFTVYRVRGSRRLKLLPDTVRADS
jgi:predicted nucleic acid-binding protein